MQSSSNSTRIARFGDFHLDLATGELRRAGAVVHLQPQPAKVLALLVSRPGEIITRAEIAETIWSERTFVDFERGMNFAIRHIRTALGDDAEHPQFLETLPKRGYRFIAPLETTEEPGTSPNAQAAAAGDEQLNRPASRRGWIIWTILIVVAGCVVALVRSYYLRPRAEPGVLVIAVLPFDDLSQVPEPYFADGLTEEMIAQLTQLNPGRMKVIARTSAMQYARTGKSARQIGRELGADYILENSIRREGERVRITTQLVRAADQTHTWAEIYDRDMRNLLPLESEVASDIAKHVHIQLLPAPVGSMRAEHQADPDVHELYLQARHYFNLRSREGIDKSIQLYTVALSKDPSYAAAYAGLADAYNLKAFYGFDESLDSVSRAKASAIKALDLDSGNAAAHAALAYTEFMWREDWGKASAEFERALDLDVNYVPAHQWFALYLAAQGITDQALNEMRFAERLDPLSPAVHVGTAYVHYLARNYEESATQAGRALELDPNSMAAHAVLGWSYTEQKKFADAITELETASQLSGGVAVYRCTLGRAYALSGNKSAAQKILAEFMRTPSPPRGIGTPLAELNLALGNREQALGWLERSGPGDIQANWLRVDPALDGVRTDPRFIAVAGRIGLDKDSK